MTPHIRSIIHANMARPLRIEYEHAFYHLTSRGNAKCRIFKDDFDRDMLLDIIKSAHDRFGFVIHAFVLMDNHYHLLMETPDANVCASMRHINGVYTQAFNRRHKVVGHLFQGRYKAFVVDRDAYYLELIRYIHLNPWRAGIVRRLNDFKYSSHCAVINDVWSRRWRIWYDRNVILGEFGRNKQEAVGRYCEFINAGKGMADPLESAIGGYALGDRSFANWLWEEFLEGKDTKELTGARELRGPIELGTVLSAVGKGCGVRKEDVLKRRRGSAGLNIARGMALHILSRHTGMTQHRIGALAGGISRKAVSEAARGFGRALLKDEKISRLYDFVMGELKPGSNPGSGVQMPGYSI